MIYTLLTIDGTDYTTEEQIDISKAISDYNTVSTFSAIFNNYTGRYSGTFALNNDVIIKSDIDITPATTVIFKGIIDDISYSGSENDEIIIISGRDYGAFLQDIIASPRVFKNTEASEIIKSLMRQNANGTGITYNNVMATTTTISKITFNGVSIYDAIRQIADIVGYYFFVDNDKDLNFIPKDSVSSGKVFGARADDSYAHYKLNDNAANTTVEDTTLYNHDGIASANTSTFSSVGKIGSAFDFDGTKYVSVATHEDLTMYDKDEMSVAFWFNLNSVEQTTGFPRLLEKEGGSPRNGWTCTYSSGTTLQAIKFETYNNNNSNQAQTYNTWASGTWYHYCATWTSGGRTNLYLDGAIAGSSAVTQTIGSNAWPMYIGASDSTPNSPFDGKLDDIRIYQRALTSTEITNLYNGGSGTEGPIGKTGNTITEASFTTADDDIFNEIKVLGARQQTFAQQEFITTTGSVYTLDAKPYNVKVSLSGAENTLYQPGGIINISNPAEEQVKYLVDFNNRQVVLASGITAGDNTVPAGSIILVDYFRSTPLIQTLRDNTSIATYGLKNKEITDKNISDLSEAVDIATTFLADHKDPTIAGTLKARGVLNITPGQTAIINIPTQNQSNSEYSMIKADYKFNRTTCFSNNVLTLSLSKKIVNFLDLIKEHELRLRSLETSEVESSITNVELYAGSIGLSGTCTIIQTGIGSGFYFNITGHDILNSPSSLLGKIEGGSTVQIY